MNCKEAYDKSGHWPLRDASPEARAIIVLAQAIFSGAQIVADAIKSGKREEPKP